MFNKYVFTLISLEKCRIIVNCRLWIGTIHVFSCSTTCTGKKYKLEVKSHKRARITLHGTLTVQQSTII